MQTDKFDGALRGVSRRQFLTATSVGSATALGGCLGSEAADQGESGEDEELSGEVTVTGSSTVYPISETMAERFMAENPEVTVRVKSTGSGGGFEGHFCPGDSDINGSSRQIKSAEKSRCGENEVTPVEMQIAGDALTMAVNTENTWADCLSFDELAQIWSEGGAETWADLNSEWPNEPFERYGPDTTSGTYDWFTETVVSSAGPHRSDYVSTEDDGTIVQGIEESQYGIGYFGYSYYEQNKDRIDALQITATTGDACTEPSLRAASDGTYPMARPLFIYPSEEALTREPVAEFVRFYLENSTADWIADDIGYVPSSDEQSAVNLDTLETIVDESSH
ncbi:phosphate ABC transporter substrate-binding protein PstS family protein [Natrinema versiforme]|uniref:Phosphate binding protein n=1 Tax=Natrinema versiforme JCM 10478 TaxID=1227496 RepID=L9Y1J7_9EURY|nr:phosphate ABC transporter substrate-binding protein PstS family protein [Natrinema versiforme]ELY67577.1 phosphate binding protein [Natrinema versiforme JCM 10478]